MKFNCGLTKEEKKQAARVERDKLKVWRPYFAWKPIRIGSRDCRWLEWIERRGRNTWDDMNDTARAEGRLINRYSEPIYGYADYWKWEYRPLQTVTTWKAG